MDNENSKISIKQLLIIFFISVASPLIRVIPKFCSDEAKHATILTPIIAIIPFILILYVLNTLFTKTKLDSLEYIYIRIFGKVIGKIVLFIYILWLIVILSLYVRYFAERFTSTILIFTPMQFFMLTILLMVYLVVRNKIEYFARFIEFYNIIFVIFIVISIFIAIPDIKIPNIYPVTTYDIKPVLFSTLPLLGIFGYITFIFFLGDKVSNKDQLKKNAKPLYLMLTGLSIIIVLLTVGVFGYRLTGDLNLPFFIFYKDIKILNIIERIDSIFISIWVVTDFAIISMFMFIEVKLIKNFFDLKTSKELVTPLIFIVYVFAQYLTSNVFELVNFSKYIFLYTNCILGFIVPIVALIVGKIRKLV